MFVTGLHDVLLGQKPGNSEQVEHLVYVVIWDKKHSFHCGPTVQWFISNPCFISVCLPPYSPFLNLIEEFFPVWAEEGL